MKIIRNGHRKLADGQRIVLGHEFIGTIEQRGRRRGRLSGRAAGRRGPERRLRALRRLHPRPGELLSPVHGLRHRPRRRAHAPSSRSPAASSPRATSCRCPTDVSDREASLLEPFSCVVNGVRSSRIELGDTVVIFGAGPIGLMHLMLCADRRRRQADRRSIRWRTAWRRARELGCDVALNPATGRRARRGCGSETDGRGADVVITACPVAEVQSQAVGLLAPFGRLCLFGGLPEAAAACPWTPTRSTTAISS